MKLISSIIILVFLIGGKVNVQAQSWMPISDSILQGGALWSIAKTGNGTIISLGMNGNIFKTSNYGVTWELCKNGLPLNISISDLKSAFGYVFLDTYGGDKFVTMDNGETWQPFNIPVPGFVMYGFRNRLLYCDASETYYTDDLINWNIAPFVAYPREQINDSMALMRSPSGDLMVVDELFNVDYFPVLFDSTTFSPYIAQTASPDGRYVYTIIEDISSQWLNDIMVFDRQDSLAGWNVFSPFPYPATPWWQSNTPEYSAVVLGIEGGVMLSLTGEASTGQHYSNIFRSVNSGNSMDNVSSVNYPINAFRYMRRLSQDTLIANDGACNILFSFDNGLTWQIRQDGYLDHYQGMFLNLANSVLLLQHKGSGYLSNPGVLRSTNSGLSFEPSNNGLPGYYDNLWDSTKYFYRPQNLYSLGNTAFVQVNDTLLFRSFDEGILWTQLSLPYDSLFIYERIFGGDNNSLILCYGRYDQFSNHLCKYFVSNDFGDTWAEMSSMQSLSGDPNAFLSAIVGQNDTMVYAMRGFSSGPQYYLYISTDNGINWSDYSGNLFSNNSSKVDLLDYASRRIPVFSFNLDGSKMMLSVSTPDGTGYADTLYVYQGGSWVSCDMGGFPLGVNISRINFENGNWIVSSNMGLYYSSDDGQTWNAGSGQYPLSGILPYRDLTADGFYEGVLITQYDIVDGQEILGTEVNGLWRKSGPIGFDEVQDNSNVKLFPNPSNAEVQIYWEENQAFDVIEVFNCQGFLLKVFPISTSSSIISLDISEFSNGIYLVRLSGKQQPIVKRFIKQ